MSAQTRASIKTNAMLAMFLASTIALAQPRRDEAPPRPLYDCPRGDRICELGGSDRSGPRISRGERPMPGYPFAQSDQSRGAGPEHSFHRGGRLPNAYRSKTYVVEDWRGHGLRQPPRGQHWVQTGGDYVLVAISTGIILEMMLSH